MRKLDKKVINETIQLLNSKYGLGLEVSYLVYRQCGDSKESHNMCEYLKDVKIFNILHIIIICFMGISGGMYMFFN